MTEMKTIVGFGASSMQGCHDTQGGFLKRLDLALNKETKHYNVINLGIGGNTTRDMVARVDDVMKYKPDCTILLLGCNDMPREGDTSPLQRTTLDEYRDNLKILLPKLLSTRNIFITSFYVKWIKEDTFTRYMNAAQELAEAHNYEIWDLLTESRPLLPGLLFTDYSHFNDSGHQFICEHLAHMLQK